MNDVQKMFRTIVNGQSAMKSELLGEIKKLDKKIDGIHKEVQDLRVETKEGFREANKRIDRIGFSVANLEDDAPTVEEFGKLKVRVTHLEQRAISI
jgi:septal ring factor EnvC (AmiA/AmiB activator)